MLFLLLGPYVIGILCEAFFLVGPFVMGTFKCTVGVPKNPVLDVRQ
jgi:hypothetical protein